MSIWIMKIMVLLGVFAYAPGPIPAVQDGWASVGSVLSTPSRTLHLQVHATTRAPLSVRGSSTHSDPVKVVAELSVASQQKRLQSCERKFRVCRAKCDRFVKARRGSYSGQALSRMKLRCSRRCRSRVNRCRTSARA